jgi:ribosomal-protein-alanine N-acetyltransferase
MLLRSLHASDVEMIAAIESAATEFSWSIAQIVDSLQSNHDCIGLEFNEELCGFAIFSKVLDEVTLLNIVIAFNQQRNGYGYFLLQQSLNQQVLKGASKCFLEVRVSNARAISLYKSLGFKQIGQRKNYYPAHHGREDALVMCWEKLQSCRSNNEREDRNASN